MPGAISFCLSFASALSGLSEGAAGNVRAFGVAALDKHLPGNGLALGPFTSSWKPALRASMRMRCSVRGRHPRPPERSCSVVLEEP